MLQTLPTWIETQAQRSAERMTLVISATHLVKHRAGFAQTVRPAKGSVLAAPIADDTPPDYFFHWVRDSAVVKDAALTLIGAGIDAAAWTERFEDYVAFSLRLGEISGAGFLARAGDFRAKMEPWILQFVRPDEEIAAIEGGRVPGDVRFSADGEIDFIKWNRPQHDGPAARALGCMRAWEMGLSSGRDARGRLADLIRGDLDYTLSHAGAPCYDVWEEENARHYYTTLLQYAALDRGARWAGGCGEHDYAGCLKRAAGEVLPSLDDFWWEERGFFRSRIFPTGDASSKDPDFAVMMGILHAGLPDGPHSIQDYRARATLRMSERLFAQALAINHRRANGYAYGRYDGDDYVGGGAWYPCTFGAAELYYRLAAAGGAEAAVHLAAGDAILGAARLTIPETGELTEQFDRDTGAQTSAKDLGWSYAAFITAWDARRRAARGADGI